MVSIKDTQSTPIVEELSRQPPISITDALPITPLSHVHTDIEMDERESIKYLTIADKSATTIPFPS
jgi:hypothetical protein